MSGMYPDRKANATILAVSLLAVAVFFGLIRRQTAISNRQFVQSMIPRHAAALLMCEEAPIDDPVILDLCRRILAGQRAEIDEMKAKLEEIEGQSGLPARLPTANPKPGLDRAPQLS